jgi:hypothetical protein
MAKSNFKTGATGIHVAASDDVNVISYGHKHLRGEYIYRVEFRGVVVGDISSTANEEEFKEIKGMIFEKSKHNGMFSDLRVFKQLNRSICDTALSYAIKHATAEDLREIWRRGVSEGQEDGREEVRAYFRKGLGLH